jgi:hypothetical protein
MTTDGIFQNTQNSIEFVSGDAAGNQITDHDHIDTTAFSA